MKALSAGVPGVRARGLSKPPSLHGFCKDQPYFSFYLGRLNSEFVLIQNEAPMQICSDFNHLLVGATGIEPVTPPA
jgi:hypothetical protein